MIYSTIDLGGVNRSPLSFLVTITLIVSNRCGLGKRTRGILGNGIGYPRVILGGNKTLGVTMTLWMYLTIFGLRKVGQYCPFIVTGLTPLFLDSSVNGRQIGSFIA